MDKSIHFAITEFNNCFIIRSPSLFLMTIFFKRSDPPFSRKSDRKKEKSVASCTHKQNIICSQTLLVDECAWADHHLQAVICKSSGGLSASEKDIAPDDAKRIIFLRLETSEAHRTRVRRKPADEERAFYKLTETAKFLDRCSVEKKRRKELWRILPILPRPYQITFHDFRELCQVIKQSSFVTFPVTNELKSMV